MAEDLKLVESVKKTQDLLGKHIKKPPLTEKLLKKPPFRFIHDIISSVIRETGFLKNLFNDEELNSANYTDKDTKLAYLTKLIDAVKLITGNELTVRGSKIISGQEPIKTNELLQAIGRSLDKKISSDEAIEYYKNTQLKKKDSKKKDSSKPSNPSSDEKKKVKKTSSGEKISSTAEKKDKMKDKVKIREKDSRGSSRDTKDSKSSSRDIRSKDRVREKIDNERDKEKIKQDKEKKDLRTASRDSRTREIRKKNSGELVKPQKNRKVLENKPESFDTEKNELDDQREVQKKGKSDIMQLNKEPVIENREENSISTILNHEVDNIENNAVSILPTIGKEENEVVKKMNEMQDRENKESKQNEEVTEKSAIHIEKRPRSALLRPPSARPPSARPAAPKVRNKPDFIVPNNVLTQMADINVIVENFDMKDDADDMVVVETGNIDDNLIVNSNDLLNNSQIGQEHGHLVAQILETQRDLMNEANVEIIPNKVEIEWDSGLKKDRDLVVKDIDKLRGTIQMLTRATNPLGKLFDFLQEDVEIMEKELRDWRNQFTGIREQLIVERNNTKELMKPLEDSLREVEANISGQMEKIYQTKCNILKNNQRISRLLSGQ